MHNEIHIHVSSNMCTVHISENNFKSRNKISDLICRFNLPIDSFLVLFNLTRYKMNRVNEAHI